MSTVNGNRLKPGMVIHHDTAVVRVVALTYAMQGRGSASITAETRVVTSTGGGGQHTPGGKLILKTRTNDKHTLADLDTQTYTYLYHDENTVYLMHPETYAQVEVTRAAAADGSGGRSGGVCPDTVEYLRGNDSVQVTRLADSGDEDGGVVVAVTPPEFVECVIDHIDTLTPVGGDGREGVLKWAVLRVGDGTDGDGGGGGDGGSSGGGGRRRRLIVSGLCGDGDTIKVRLHPIEEFMNRVKKG